MREEQWRERHCHSLGWVLESSKAVKYSSSDRCVLLLLFNTGSEDEQFVLPRDGNIKKWRCLLDTVSSDGLPSVKEKAPGKSVSMLHKSMQLFVAVFK